MEVQQAEPPKVKPHPRQCHLCQYDGVNAAGKPFNAEAAAACLSCKGVDMKNVHDGYSWVSMDASASPDLVYCQRVALDYAPKAPPTRVLTGQTDDTAEWLKFLYSDFSTMTPQQARIIHGLANGHTVRNVATVEKIAPANAAAQIRTALHQHPYLRAVWFAVRSGVLTLPRPSCAAVG